MEEIIQENIEYFWSFDPLVGCENDTQKLWEGFKSWCVQDLIDVFDGISEEDAVIAVETKYQEWLDFGKKG